MEEGRQTCLFTTVSHTALGSNLVPQGKPNQHRGSYNIWLTKPTIWRTRLMLSSALVSSTDVYMFFDDGWSRSTRCTQNARIPTRDARAFNGYSTSTVYWFCPWLYLGLYTACCYNNWRIAFRHVEEAVCLSFPLLTDLEWISWRRLIACTL